MNALKAAMTVTRMPLAKIPLDPLTAVVKLGALEMDVNVQV